MKRVIATILTVSFMLSVAAGLTGCFRAPKDWYKSTLDYYAEGVKTGWANENNVDNEGTGLGWEVADEIKDPNNDIGYLLVDLDGDGTDELLIGFNDGSNATKFTDVVVFSFGTGANRLMNGTNGYYIYLCASNVLCDDSWYGSETQRSFMKWDGKNQYFTVIDGDGKYLPKKWELTKFQ